MSTQATEPGTAARPTSTVAEVARGRRMLVGIAALFFVPLGIAFVLYYSGGWTPAGRTNHGELIAPPRPLGDAPFTLADGTTSARADLLRGKWTLVYVGSGACNEACRKALWTMRQTRQLLAENIDRVQRVFIANGSCCDTEFLGREHVGLDVVQAIDPAARDVLAVFPTQGAAHSIFIVDPLGNLMMQFDSRENPKGLLTDLEKLLKLSHIG